jgi:hypothetical protein
MYKNIYQFIKILTSALYKFTKTYIKLPRIGKKFYQSKKQGKNKEKTRKKTP